MFRQRVLFPVLWAGLIISLLLLAAGCGRDSFFGHDQPAPLSSDVIVIGDSAAALVAALEAAQNGASVLVFHKLSDEDGWIFDEGAIAAVEAEEEEEENATAELRDILAAYSGGSGRHRHFSLLAEKTGPDLEWLERETGLEMVMEHPYRLRPDNLSASQLYNRLTTAALNEGVRFLDGTEVHELLVDEPDNVLTGIRFYSASGKIRDAYTRALILADGGILGHEELMEELAPAVGIASWRRSQMGIGWQAAMEAGLDLVDANLFAYAPARDNNDLWIEAQWPAAALMVVDNRIAPLAGMTKHELVLELLDSSDQAGYLVVAESQISRDADLNWPRYEGIDAFMEAYRIDLPQLRRWYHQPWEVFYGIEVKAVAEYCLGGIVVNENGEALRGGEPVQGLYAAGEITGGLHGWSLAPGAAFSEALVWGRLVGRNAAEHALR